MLFGKRVNYILCIAETIAKAFGLMLDGIYYIKGKEYVHCTEYLISISGNAYVFKENTYFAEPFLSEYGREFKSCFSMCHVILYSFYTSMRIRIKVLHIINYDHDK